MKRYIRTIKDHLSRKLTGKPSINTSKVNEYLFVGGQYSKKGIEYLKKHGVTAIVCMRLYDPKPLINGELKILHLPTPNRKAPSISHLMEGIKFINNEIENGGKVYVHCNFGVGRGPAMAIAYLISQGMTFENAYKTVERARPFIKLSPEQKEILQELESVLKKDELKAD